MGMIRIEDPWYGCSDRKDDEHFREIVEDNIKYLNGICEDDMIFMYGIGDAWFKPLAEIKVYNDGTVVTITEDKVQKHHINEEITAKITAFIAANREYLDNDETNFERLCYLDGYTYDIILWDGRYHYFEGHGNIQGYTDEYPIGHQFTVMIDVILDMIRAAGIPCSSEYVYDWLKN